MNYKYFLVLLLFPFILASCDTNYSSTESLSEIKANTKTNEVIANTNIESALSTCNCPPTHYKCETDCLFSSCCICCDSEKYNCEAGCYVGFADCVCREIGKLKKEESPMIKLKSTNIDKLLAYIRNDLKINSKEIDSLYQVLIDGSIKISNNDTYGNNKYGPIFSANEKLYYNFLDAYKQFVEGLDKKEHNLVTQFTP